MWLTMRAETQKHAPVSSVVLPVLLLCVSYPHPWDAKCDANCLLGEITELAICMKFFRISFTG